MARDTKNAVIAACAAAIAGALVTGVLTGVLPDLLFGDDDDRPLPPPAGEISTPVGGQEVSSSFIAKGSVSDVPLGQEVWLALDFGHALFPVEQIEAPVRGTRPWRRLVYLPGRPASGFALALLLVGDEGQRQIAEWSVRRTTSPIPGIAGSQTLDELSDLRPRLCARDPIHTASIVGVAQLTSVESDEDVGQTVNPLVGTYRLDSESRANVWVFVYSAVADRFYPQSHHDPRTFGGDLSATLLSDGRFRAAAAFGGQPGEQYELLAVFADPAASRSLSRTLRRWARTGDFVGLASDELPSGLDEKQCVPVRLRVP